MDVEKIISPMKKNIFALLLVSVLFSCKDTKEIKPVKNTKITKDTLSTTIESKNDFTEEEFKSNFEILIPRSYRTYGKNPAASLNEKWVDLYEENGEYYLGKANFEIEKGFDECSGDSLLSIMPKNKTVLFIDYPELKTGKVKAVKVKKRKVWPKEKVSFTFNNVNYTLRGEGKVLSDHKADAGQDGEEVFKEVAHYKLYLTIGNGPEKLLLAEEAFQDTFVELLFAGDIDGDGKLDFVFGASRNYEEERVILFLSSKAGSAQEVKKVSEIAVQFDC